MLVNWSTFKNFINTRNLSIQWIDINNKYYLKGLDGYFTLSCELDKSPSDTTDLLDFENNYKNSGNKPPQQIIQAASLAPFGAKTLNVNGVIKKLFARFTGIQQALTQGSNTISYTLTYPWAKILGVEVINCEALDYVDFKVYDNASGTYSNTPNLMLNQFSFALNLPKDYYIRMAQFDADIYTGMVIEITYNSVSAKTVGINLLINEVKS